MKLDSMQLDDLQTLAQSTLTKLKENLNSSKQSSMSITEDLKRLRTSVESMTAKISQLRTDLERSKKWNKRFSIIMGIEAVIIALLIILWRVL